MRQKKKMRLRLWAFLCLFIFFFSLILYSSYRLLTWHHDNKQVKIITENIQKSITPKQIHTQGELVNPPQEKESDYWYYVNLPFYEVDFNKLIETNSDTVAFIHMNNTNINYPIVQTTDNHYYLEHAFDKSKNSAGWVFMDYRNDPNAINDNVVIYGHGRLDNTVFGSLKNSLTSSWQSNRDNYIIWLSTRTENLMYQIFSIYTIPSESYYIETNFVDATEKQNWVSTMKSRNIAPIDTEVSNADAILTLSTCENNNGGRIVVQAKLIKRQAK